MKLVKLVEPQCPCHSKLFAFTASQRESGIQISVGTVAECDCGRVYKLQEHQFDGEYWEQQRQAVQGVERG